MSTSRTPRTSRTPEIPLPWERLLWSGRPRRLATLFSGEHYFLTDFRLARVSRRTAPRVDELVLHDVDDVQRSESRLDRLFGTSTLVVHPRRRGRRALVLTGLRNGAPLAGLVALLSWA